MMFTPKINSILWYNKCLIDDFSELKFVKGRKQNLYILMAEDSTKCERCNRGGVQTSDFSVHNIWMGPNTIATAAVLLSACLLNLDLNSTPVTTYNHPFIL